MEYTTIRITKNIAVRIGQFGGFHDTYDTILNSLCEHAENCSLLSTGGNENE